jgi:hypothetical protein
MTICRKCGTSNQDGKKFCVFCHELLIADPVELEKRAAAAQKKLNKAQKKLDAKHKRWKRALLLLIPIGLLDFLNLLLCLDIAFIGIGSAIGGLAGDLLQNLIGNIISLFGNDVYTDQTVQFIFRVLELLGAVGLLLIASLLTIVMIVRMIKWRRYRKNGDKQEELLKQTAQELHADEKIAQPTADTVAAEQSAQQVKVAMGEQTVSYAALAALDAQSEAYTMPAPASEIAPAQLLGALSTLLWEYDEDSVRRIVSAMSASRLLLCSAGALDSADIFDRLSRALCVNAEQYTCENTDESGTEGIARVLLQRDAQSDATVHTSCVRALYTASFSPRNVCLAGVGGVGAAEINTVFDPLAGYFSVPTEGVGLYLGKASSQSESMPLGVTDEMLLLPANLWIMSVLPERDHVPVVGGKLAMHAVAVYLRNSGRAVPPESAEGAQPVTVAVDALERAVLAAEGEYYLTDEYWRVIDLLEQRMIEAGADALSNRTLRMLEKYSAMFLACGGKMSDAFDNAFAAVLIPACAEGLRVLAEASEGESLSALLERTVGKEKMPMTVEVLSSMNLI